MKRFCRCFTAMLTMALLLSVFPVTAHAEPYTYTVTFYAGNQGNLTGTQGISVQSASAEVRLEGGRIVVRGLHAEDIVSFDAQAGAVSMNDSSKYYVKGVRQSGRDNNEMVSSSFRVEGDADYVVAYGIQGSMVSYTVNYHDEDGNELAPSRTYYGNVGDKPVVAHVYVEGYTPQALALTKTLSANEAENVFTFEYREGETQIIETPGETITTIITEQTEGEGTGTAGAGTGAGATGAGAGAAGAGAGAAGEGTGVAGEDAGAAGEGAGVAGEDAGAAEGTTAEGETTEVEDEEVPQDLVDLDDEEAPKANIELDKEEVKKGFPMAAGIAVSVVAVAALAGMIIFLKRHRH
nr:MucBP domain-containing protein [uncultured Blautia sp.]